MTKLSTTTYSRSSRVSNYRKEAELLCFSCKRCCSSENAFTPPLRYSHHPMAKK